jgi:hypothetical protein
MMKGCEGRISFFMFDEDIIFHAEITGKMTGFLTMNGKRQDAGETIE